MSGSPSFDSDQRMFDDLRGRLPRRPRAEAALRWVQAVSALLGLGLLVLVVVGVAMLLRGTWPVKLAGAAALGVAWELRPRLPRPGEALGRHTAGDAPALIALLDEIGRRLRCPRVNEVVVDDTFTATCGRYGVRRRPVLTVGLPLWAALGPPGRVALLAHQLAHLVDGDPGQTLLVQPAMTTFAVFAEAGSRRGAPRSFLDTADPWYGYGFEQMHREPAPGLMHPVEQALLTPVRAVSRAVDRRIRQVTARGRRRAEYYADALAAQVAGTAGMTDYLHVLLLDDEVFTTTRRWLRVGGDVGLIGTEIAELIARHSPEDVHRRAQLDMHERSHLLADHPPTGRRLLMLQSWPVTEPTVTVSPDTLAAIDAELAADYRRVARSLANAP